MYHKTRLSIKNKIDIWLNLCDFSFKLLKENLTKKEFEKMIKKNRQKHLDIHCDILNKIIKSEKKS